MQVDVVTLFPEIFPSVLSIGMTGRAQIYQSLTVFTTNPRLYTSNRHHRVDDAPYGGGSGMVMCPEPLIASLEAITASRGPGYRILLSPSGSRLTQKKIRDLSVYAHLILVCGRYEGFDERISKVIDEEISLGDFILSGGELAALVLIDAIARLQKGVLHNENSALEESFEQNLLEYPQYTRPRVYQGMEVPAVLLSGDHEKIRLWRRKQSLLRTKERRPDLFEKVNLTEEDRRLLEASEKA